MAEQATSKMMLLSKSTTEEYSYVKNCVPTTFSLTIPIVDLSKSDAQTLIVKACEEFGFFKVINHGVPMEIISQLEYEAFKFFSMPLDEKKQVGPPNPFGYGNKKIGCKGDIGLVEYLLLNTDQEHNSVLGQNLETFRCLLNNYMFFVRKMACEILELMAEGLNIKQKNVFSKLLMDKQSDSIFRVNHFPAASPEDVVNDHNLIGFGAHTDPQIISLLWSSNTPGLQIYLKDGNWISVPPDQKSFFINVGDCLQVMTNERFLSVRHRVLAKEFKSRISMIYFGGPPLNEKIVSLPSLMKEKESLYKKFTWSEYKISMYDTKLGDNRLQKFERIVVPKC